MKLDILMATYDRLVPYFNSVKSIKPVLEGNADIHLTINVDSKASNSMFIFKKLVTKMILGNLNYSFGWGCECIGKTRTKMISESTAEYFMNFDDDDLLDASNLLKTDLSGGYDIYNFDYYADSNITPESARSVIYLEYDKITPKYWFSSLDTNVSIGQSSIFRRELFLSIKHQYRYFRKYVDDMLPNHVMYMEAKSIVQLNYRIVIRTRGEKSLMNTTNLTKYSEIVKSLEEFRGYLRSRTDLNDHYRKLVWKITLSNQLKYHEIKSGIEFFNLLHGYFNYESLWAS